MLDLTEVRKMAEPFEKIPAELRWQMATKGLTGAYVAVSEALRQSLGEEKYDQFDGELWHQAGKGIKEFVDALQLPVGDARQLGEAMQLAAQTLTGPESRFEVIEATTDRSVVRVSKCAWYERFKEQGVDHDCGAVGHKRWNDGAVESLNPDFVCSIPKAMPRGDKYCEIVLERKK